MYLIFNSTGARRTPEGKKITTVRFICLAFEISLCCRYRGLLVICAL
jgi:hypothetical protein